ncbi:MAG: hypothetical protein L3J66_11030 [Bacteroidales bacterium]|nr:hypothetical protein [Bacteroidales bacterium]
MEKHRVLIVDENDIYEKKLENHASNNYDFTHYEDWESAISELQDNPNIYDAIIIDGNVKPDADTERGDIRNLHDALVGLKELRRTDQIFIPYLIIAANPKEFLKFSKKEPIIDKNDIKKLLAELRNHISSKDEYKIQIKYSSAFGAFGEKYLSENSKKNLVEVLMDFENNKWSENSFNPLRKIIESIYKNLHKYDDSLLPDSCVDDNGRVNLEYCNRRLAGLKNDYVTFKKEYGCVLYEHLGWIIGPITKVCHIASHSSPNKNLTKYSLGTIIFGVIDLLIWYKAFVDKNYKTN